jgi:hypothetical protein
MLLDMVECKIVVNINSKGKQKIETLRPSGSVSRKLAHPSVIQGGKCLV